MHSQYRVKYIILIVSRLQAVEFSSACAGRKNSTKPVPDAIKVTL